jgi:hypothetical protein
MFRIIRVLLLGLILLQCNHCNADVLKENRVFYAGAQGVKLRDTLVLSDGSLLVSGSAQSLKWLPSDTKKIVLNADGISNQAGGTSIGFLIHLSPNADRVLACAALPTGTVETLARVRTTNVPGQPTGALLISGLTQNGYFIGKLDNNFVKSDPTKIVWTRNVRATGDHREGPVWDVGSDGKVLFAEGSPISADWTAVARLKADGSDDVVEDWRYHWGEQNGKEIQGAWTPASSRTDLKVTHSGIIFKLWGRPDLRSWTQADYDEYSPDGNGGTKKGAWPLDAFFAGPASTTDPKSAEKSGGYTGYKPGRNPTARVGDIVVDRRNNNFYIGYCFQSRLPAGEPDFEPGILAMSETGKLKWWSRLYSEFLDKNGNGKYDDGEPRNSSPDQYVDFLALDSKFNALVVGARCHGNNEINFWNGNQIASREGERGFKNGFSGSGGNFHISWIGKLGLDDGMLFASTYVAEMGDTQEGAGKPSDDPLLDGWPDPNSGWAKLNTTRLRKLSVDENGRVLIAGVGRRVLTTSNAFQKMLKKDEGVSSWSDFVRIYKPDLSGVEYSSTLTGSWDKTTGEGGGNIELSGVAFVPGGVLAAGANQTYDAESVRKSAENAAKGKGEKLSTDVIGKAKGNPVPTANAPAWGSDKPDGGCGVLALLKF